MILSKNVQAQVVSNAKPKNAPIVHNAPLNDYLSLSTNDSVATNDAAQMLGHFTSRMPAQGFPWRLRECSQDGKVGEQISDFDALRRLNKGQGVSFQPMRNLQLDLGADNWGAVAMAGTMAGGEASTLTKVANVSKESKVSGGTLGVELVYGEPVNINSTGELKLLHQIYNPAAEVREGDKVARAANQLSRFTQNGGKTAWRVYEEKDETGLARAKRVSGVFIRDAGKAAAAGAAIGAGFGVFIGILTHSYTNALLAVGAGAVAVGGFTGAQSALAAAKGQPLNALETLDKVLNNEEVVFQKINYRSTGLPFFRDISWYTDAGPGNKISNLEELDTLSAMLVADPVKEAKKDAPKA